jgi:hypothetical protein
MDDPPPPPPPPAEAPDLVHPRIRVAVYDDWDLYLEWDRVQGVSSYTVFGIVNPDDSPDDPYVVDVVVGIEVAPDRRSTSFGYLELCAAVANSSHPGGWPYHLWAQVWPGDDSSRAENAEATGRIFCPAR